MNRSQHDPNADENGEYDDGEGRYQTKEWNIPVNFKVGISVTPIVSNYQQLLIEADYQTPNSNYEFMNIGSEYSVTIPRYGKFSLRAGYKGLFMEENQFGLTYGGGLNLWVGNNYDLGINYGTQSIGPLGNINSFSVTLSF